MQLVSVGRDVAAPAAAVSDLLIDTDRWADWSPSDHRVRALDDERSRIEFGVARSAAPCLLVDRVALTRVADLAVAEVRP